MKFFFVIIVIIFASCNFKQYLIRVDLRQIDNITFCDSNQEDFESFIDEIQDGGVLIKNKYSLYFLPDSIVSKIPKKNILFAEFKTRYLNYIIVKINSNGDSCGEILLFCFSECGDLIDYMLVERYSAHLAKEIVVLNDTTGFEFEVIETEILNSNVMPLFMDNQDSNRQKWILSKSGKFVSQNISH